MQTFKDNQTVFFLYEPSGKGAGQATAYAKAGINVIRVKCVGQDHVGINKKFFQNGVYDFQAGGMLPSENYVYQIYNNETGNWDDLNASANAGAYVDLDMINGVNGVDRALW